MSRFFDINIEVQGENERVSEKTTIAVEEINDNENETEYASVEYPLNMCRTASNQITLISEILIKEEKQAFISI